MIGFNIIFFNVLYSKKPTIKTMSCDADFKVRALQEIKYHKNGNTDVCCTDEESLALFEKYMEYFMIHDQWTDFVVDLQSIYKDFGMKSCDQMTKFYKKNYKEGVDYQRNNVDKKEKIHITPCGLKHLCILINNKVSSNLLCHIQVIEALIHHQNISQYQQLQNEISVLSQNYEHHMTQHTSLKEVLHRLQHRYDDAVSNNKRLSTTQEELSIIASKYHSINKKPHKSVGMIEHLYIIQKRTSMEIITHIDESTPTSYTSQRSFFPLFKIVNSNDYKYESSNKVVYTKTCFNMHLTETAVHHKLSLMYDNYDEKAWTNNIPFSKLREIVDSVQMNLDGEDGFYSGDISLILSTVEVRKKKEMEQVCPPQSKRDGWIGYFKETWNKCFAPNSFYSSPKTRRLIQSSRDSIESKNNSPFLNVPNGSSTWTP